MKQIEDFEFYVRPAVKMDLDQLVELGARFYQESNFLKGASMSKKNYRQTLDRYIGLPYTAGILAVRDGQVIGYVYIYAQSDYTVELIGECYQFFVLPEYRGSGVARALVEAAVLQYADWKVARAYVEAAPGMDDPQHIGQFKNLWGRYGYQQIGIVMLKEFDYGSKSTGADRPEQGRPG